MSLLRPHTCRLPIRTAQRTFSTTASRPASLQIDRNDPDDVADTVPAYPHGPARWYKQSNKGLYGGQRIQFGNNVSGDFNTKTRRTFQVNVLSKRLWSHALDRFVQVRVTARTLRTIDRVGGLDEYLLGDKAARIKQLGVSGWWLRWAIMQQPAIKQRFRKERYHLGLGRREGYERKLKKLEQSTVGADIEEAYAALPEEDEADAIAAAAESIEANEEHASIPTEAAIESEAPLPSDEVFAVTSPPDLPPLKFRTDRGKHIVLGPQGWIRTKPNRTEYSKKWFAEQKHKDFVSSRMAAFSAELARMREEEMPEMSLIEEKEILREARRRFMGELNAKAEYGVQNQEVQVKDLRVKKQVSREVRAENKKMKKDRKKARKSAYLARQAASGGADVEQDRRTEPDTLDLAQ